VTIRAVDLSGRYEIVAMTNVRVAFANPEVVNPNWYHAGLDGGISTPYAQNVTMILSAEAPPVDLSGTGYEIATVTADEITLVNPAGVNADWGQLSSYGSEGTYPLSSWLSAPATSWIGPFIVEANNTDKLVANFVALGGLYKDDGEDQDDFPISIELEATPVNPDDQAIGPTQTFNGTIPGNTKDREMRALTLVCELNNPGRQSVRARRTTPKDYNFEGQVVDEVKWQDLYGVAPVDQPDFGDVTTIRTRTYATEGALSVKERRLNLLATRRIAIYDGGGWGGPLTASNHAGHIICAIARDTALGNREDSELDVDSIFGAMADAENYFGHSDPVRFSYTFDNDETSFEEMVETVARAAFCTAYRQGNQIKLSFERATNDSTMLFNHRNKVPGSEQRIVSFGPLDDHDGVELEYVRPEDDTPATIYLPADRSARKPRKVTAVGVRTHRQAYWAAWRVFNKIRYQTQSTEFTALQEAAPLVINDRILNADNTRADTQDGEVEAQDGLELTLSREVDLTDSDGYTIFLQLPDATVDSISITAGTEPDRVVLARAPLTALALDERLYARTTYNIVPNSSPRSAAFLLTEKTPDDGMTYSLKAINYSGLYYINDGLELWLAFEAPNYFDSSPHARDGTPAGGAVTVVDVDRDKRVHEGGAGGRSVDVVDFAPTPSYSVAAWFKGIASAGSILSTVGNAQRFYFGGGELRADHAGNSPVAAAWPGDGEWHHAALTFDNDTDELRLFIDGRLVDSAGGTPIAATVNVQTVLNGLVGRADDLRLWRRALTDRDVRELYHATIR
jgi:hypothetical protein